SDWSAAPERVPVILYLCPGGEGDPGDGLATLYRHVRVLADAGFAVEAVDVTKRIVDAFPSDLLVVPEVLGDQLATLAPGRARVALCRDVAWAWRNVADPMRHPYLSAPDLRAVLCQREEDGALLAHAFPTLAVPLLRLAGGVPIGLPSGLPSDEGGLARFEEMLGRPRRPILAYVAGRRPERAAALLGALQARGALAGWKLERLDQRTEADRRTVLAQAAVLFTLSDASDPIDSVLEALALGASVVGFEDHLNHEAVQANPGVVRAEMDDLLACALLVEDLLARAERDPEAAARQRTAAAQAAWATLGRQASLEAAALVATFGVLAPDQRATLSAGAADSEVTSGPVGPPAPVRAPRPAASIVILAWNAWEQTKACLDALAETLRPDDEVIVVDNGSRDATGAGLSLYPWLRVLTNEDNHGFARGCNEGAALATNELLVFLNNDTVVSNGWLESLCAPFADSLVGAAGPRSNSVSGTQLLSPVPYDRAPSPEFHAFASAWAERAYDAISETIRLVGFCMAVRRDAFVEVEGFDERFVTGGFEDDDLCRKLAGMGWRLVVAHEAFVHHAGHASFDANGVDWFAIQQENQVRYLEKWLPQGATA
ncbi:MAG: polypeptide N-acetylgalactosaminyltransferase, partial [Acidimicrobiaceae bacterium]|nr:polypeptide N-acetylgalactosaminyltransferase [Acidimicrobiaceae bacterium]